MNTDSWCSLVAFRFCVRKTVSFLGPQTRYQGQERLRYPVAHTRAQRPCFHHVYGHGRRPPGAQSGASPRVRRKHDCMTRTLAFFLASLARSPQQKRICSKAATAFQICVACQVQNPVRFTSLPFPCLVRSFVPESGWRVPAGPSTG